MVYYTTEHGINRGLTQNLFCSHASRLVISRHETAITSFKNLITIQHFYIMTYMIRSLKTSKNLCPATWIRCVEHAQRRRHTVNTCKYTRVGRLCVTLSAVFVFEVEGKQCGTLWFKIHIDVYMFQKKYCILFDIIMPQYRE